MKNEDIFSPLIWSGPIHEKAYSPNARAQCLVCGQKAAAWVQGSWQKMDDPIGHDAPRIRMRSHSIIHHNIAIAHVTSLQADLIA
jgi:hypothetical protein